MRIGEVLNAVYDKDVGWRPATGAIKPVHIANGMCRALTGEVRDTKRIVNFLIPWQKKNDRIPDPKRTYEQLVERESPDRFKAFKGGGQNKERFETLRQYARGLLAADQAVFPKATDSSLTLTCRQMISTDSFDREVGRFAAEILCGRDGKGALGQEVLRCLKEGSESPQDPITLLCWPLLSKDADPYVSQKSLCKPHDSKRLKEFFELVEMAAESLADHEKAQGNRLGTLQRSVLFACLSLLSYVQALAVGGQMARRSPLLISMDAPKGSRLALASEESLNTFYESFEDWLTSQVAGRLKREQPLVLATEDGEEDQSLPSVPALRRDSVEKWLREVRADRDEAPNKEILADRMCLYEQAVVKHGKDDPSLVLAETLVQSYKNEYVSGGPRQFLGGVGRKAGIIFPHFQGRSKDKRIKPSVSILDVLVRCCTPVSSPIPLNDFLNNMWQRFGLIAGGRSGNSSDSELLERSGIAVSRADLEVNTAAFIDHLERIGLARRYPDNITYVGKFNA